MKILVCYFSQTRNTEIIAQSIYEEAVKGNEAEMKKVESIHPAQLTGYDVIFIGSPLHSGQLVEPVKSFLSGLEAGSAKKMAGFITHFAPAYPEQSMVEFTEPMQTACKEKSIDYTGCFNCQGALIESLHEAVQKKLNLSDLQWAEMVDEMTGHPNSEDVAQAKVFTKKVLS